MFGTNPIRKQDLEHGDALHVQNIFHTIQGEGPFAGVPAVFVRLAGCNLRCYFCDTDFETKYENVRDVENVVSQVAWRSLDKTSRQTKLVVLTGGEPFRQNIVPLCCKLAAAGFHVQIETAGTLWVAGMDLLIQHGQVSLVCSPKTGKLNGMIAEWCHHWKYLIRENETAQDDGLPTYSTQHEGVALRLARPPRHDDTVWLQPCEAYKVGYQAVDLSASVRLADVDAELADQRMTSSVRDEEQSQRNIKLCAELAIKHNYRISLQLHKYLGLE